MQRPSAVPKRGRPPVAAGNKLDQQVRINFSSAQLKAVVEAAQQVELPLSTWLRHVVLKELGLADD